MAVYELAKPYYDMNGHLIVGGCEECEVNIYEKIYHECANGDRWLIGAPPDDTLNDMM